MALTLAQLSEGKLNTVERHIDALNDSVFINQISTDKIDEINKIQDSEERGKTLFMLCVTDAVGTKLTPEMYDQFSKNNCLKAIREISDKILEENGLSTSGE